MLTEPPMQVSRSGSHVYAQSLYSYAAGRLDDFSLRCWVIQRLMMDDGLDHDAAEAAFEHVLELTRRADSLRRVRARKRRGRRDSIRRIVRSDHGWRRRPGSLVHRLPAASPAPTARRAA